MKLYGIDNVTNSSGTGLKPTATTPTEQTNGETNSSVYAQLKAIANGQTEQTNTNGASTAYNENQNAQNTYKNLYDFYQANANNMSNGEKQTALGYLGTAQDKATNAKSYYDQYLDLQNSAEASKDSQYAAQQNALKYTQSSLNQQGLGTQGVAESTKAGLNNAYSRNVANIDNAVRTNETSLYDTYKTNVNNANLANEQNAVANEGQQQTENYSYASQLIENATSQGDWDKVKEYYNQYQDKLSGNDLNMLNEQMAASYDSIVNNKVAELGGDVTKTLVLHENNTNKNARISLEDFIKNNNVSDGTIFRLNKNTAGGNDYYYTYYNGNLYEIDRKKVDVASGAKNYYFVDGSGVKQVDNKKSVTK